MTSHLRHEARNTSVHRAGWATLLAVTALLAVPDCCLAQTKAANPEADWAVNHPPLTAEQTRAFIREMSDYVERWHLQRDHSPQRGTTHEFVVTTRLKGDKLPQTNPGQWGQWVQATHGDTIHTSMYHAIAMFHATRATGDERYRKFATDYTLPWLHKMITQSDTLFPVQKGTVRSGVTMKIGDTPVKGYVPFRWDDGQVLSIMPELMKEMDAEKDMIIGKVTETTTANGLEYRFHGYTKAVSQHMGQDMAIMLTEAWWNTHDPRVREAAETLLHFYDTATPWKIHVITGAGAVVAEDEARLRKLRFGSGPAERSTTAFDILYGYHSGDPEKKRPAPDFHDGESYRFYVELMRNGTRLTEDAALALTATGYFTPLLIQYWSDTGPMPYGIDRYDRAQATLIWTRGAPIKYRSKGMIPLGCRAGPHQLVHAAFALQAQREFPNAWAAVKEKKHPGDWLVPVHPETSAKQEVWSEPWSLAAGKLELKSRRHSLDFRGESAKPEFVLQIHGRPDAGKPFAKITLKQDGGIKAVNHDGKPVNLTGKVVAKGSGFIFELNIPYTANKGQSEWANGIDHGRYLVAIGGEQRVAYLLTAQPELVEWLERFVSTGLANWHAIFKQHGFLPVVVAEGNKKHEWGNAGPADKISHLYGYPFLISTAAQHLLYQEGKTYWPVDQSIKL